MFFVIITTYILITYNLNNANNANNGFLGISAENTQVEKTRREGRVGKNVFCVIKYLFFISFIRIKFPQSHHQGSTSESVKEGFNALIAYCRTAIL